MEKSVQSYQNLDVWKRSRKFVKEIYALTAKFPRQEMYGLTSQMRRAAVSIPSNLEFLEFAQLNAHMKELGEIARMLNGLYASLEKRLLPNPEPQTLTPEPSL